MARPTPDGNDRPQSAEELLAHALEVTHDSIDRYRQLQGCLQVHHNPDAALILQRIIALSLEQVARLSAKHAAEHLPKIAPWQLRWRCPPLLSDGNHRVSPRQVLEIVLAHERCAQGFYLSAAANADPPEARQILETITRLQALQITRLETLLASTVPTPLPSPEDLDPPQRPD